MESPLVARVQTLNINGPMGNSHQNTDCARSTPVAPTNTTSNRNQNHQNQTLSHAHDTWWTLCDAFTTLCNALTQLRPWPSETRAPAAPMALDKCQVRSLHWPRVLATSLRKAVQCCDFRASCPAKVKVTAVDELGKYTHPQGRLKRRIFDLLPSRSLHNGT